VSAQRVLDHHVFDADRPQAAAQVCNAGHVQAREVRDVNRRRAGELLRERRDLFLFLRFGAVH